VTLLDVLVALKQPATPDDVRALLPLGVRAEEGYRVFPGWVAEGALETLRALPCVAWVSLAKPVQLI
jgi:hypothetical protein